MRKRRLFVPVALLVASCSSPQHRAASLPHSSSNPFRIGRPLVIPHGGGDGLFPENTLYAYQHSVALGGDVIDADVQMTADGVPVAFHDSTLERTTNGAGSVNSWTYAELAKLDAAWAFEVNGDHPLRGQGITVPSIGSLLAAFPDTLFTLDLKDLRASVVPPLCDLSRSTDHTADVYIGVDTTEQVALFRKDCPEVQTSGTDAERQAARVARQTHDTTFVSHQEVSQPEYIGADGDVRVTADTLAFAHRSDTAVLTWVVDDPDEMRTLIAMGVDGIYTRRPDVMIGVLEEMGIER